MAYPQARFIAKWLLVVIAIFGVGTSAQKSAICAINPDIASEEHITGILTFTQGTDKVTITGEIKGFNAGDTTTKHGFHVHEAGVVVPRCSEANGHYNPGGVDHGLQNDDVRHVGDLGSIEEGTGGIATINIEDSIISLEGDNSIIGKSIVVHATEDLGSAEQPSGAAGSRLGCCLIREKPSGNTLATCDLKTQPDGDQQISGIVTFVEENGMMSVTGSVNGFNTTDADTKHGFHIHANGVIEPDCSAAGPHYNPDEVAHGLPTDTERHVGDLGNIEGAEKSIIVDISVPMLSMSGDKSILGKAIVVHASEDKGSSEQPSGDAGSRLACCVIVAQVGAATGDGGTGGADGGTGDDGATTAPTTTTGDGESGSATARFSVALTAASLICLTQLF